MLKNRQKYFAEIGGVEKFWEVIVEFYLKDDGFVRSDLLKYAVRKKSWIVDASIHVHKLQNSTSREG